MALRWRSRGSVRTRKRGCLMRAGPTRRAPHDWMAPDWNWGYARGAAHDAAFELRQRLGRREDREKWIQDDSIPWDETVLCLALRIQRSCNYGRDAAGFGSVLDALAAGEYGSASAPNAALVGALSARLVEGLGQQEPGSDAEAIQRSLIALGFLEEGL